ncbi:hypothetical protein [Flavobacterium sp. FlaQc-50]|jgi:hypothetical protein|uniref:hypothetical protein n=1 Tax=unclassified Flavobacterium TaxID=196869 RepID=UPI00375796DA
MTPKGVSNILKPISSNLKPVSSNLKLETQNSKPVPKSITLLSKRIQKALKKTTS